VFSPFTQRALRPVESARIFPAAERRLDLVEPWLEDEPRPVPSDLVPPLDRAPDLVWEPAEVREAVEEELGTTLDLTGTTEPDRVPQGQPFAFEAQRPAISARGLAEAENELAAFVRGGQRVVVAFPHRGEALRTEAMLRKIDARIVESDENLPREPELVFA